MVANVYATAVLDGRVQSRDRWISRVPLPARAELLSSRLSGDRVSKRGMGWKLITEDSQCGPLASIHTHTYPDEHMDKERL